MRINCGVERYAADTHINSERQSESAGHLCTIIVTRDYHAAVKWRDVAPFIYALPHKLISCFSHRLADLSIAKHDKKSLKVSLVVLVTSSHLCDDGSDEMIDARILQSKRLICAAHHPRVCFRFARL